MEALLCEKRKRRVREGAEEEGEEEKSEKKNKKSKRRKKTRGKEEEKKSRRRGKKEERQLDARKEDEGRSGEEKIVGGSGRRNFRQDCSGYPKQATDKPFQACGLSWASTSRLLNWVRPDSHRELE